ncbi:phosphopyruvate hydratase [Candidatus Uhrbacteria bacterium]|nr:phosphopyruvate hydratase [Candidatus Uhrbacteria bacterium]
MKIKKIFAQEILDSRGNPTVKVRVMLRNGAMGDAAVPSGASTGTHEAAELRDHDKKRYGGKGVLKAVKNVNTVIAKKVRGMSVANLRAIDAAMIKLDGTKNKRKLGANAILGVSLACAHAGARASGMPLYKWLRKTYSLTHLLTYSLPIPTMNVLNGGAHADWTIDFQECMIVPQHQLFRERVRIGSEVFHALRAILKEKGFSVGVGDEGGFAPRLKRNADALAMIALAVKKSGYRLGKDVCFAMDPAASEFYDPKTKKYTLRTDGKALDAKGMIAMWAALTKKYPFVSLEDGLAEDDWEGWVELMRTLAKSQEQRAKSKHPNSTLYALRSMPFIIGDDLFTTNVARLKKGIALSAANAILIKVNQIGTLSETIDTILLAQKHGYAISVSHRSGETADTTIADLAVAVNAEFIKAGAPSRGERIAKYNRLMEIEQELAH